MVSFVDFAPAEPQKGRAVACLIGLFKDGWMLVESSLWMKVRSFTSCSTAIEVNFTIYKYATKLIICVCGRLNHNIGRRCSWAFLSFIEILLCAVHSMPHREMESKVSTKPSTRSMLALNMKGRHAEVWMNLPPVVYPRSSWDHLTFNQTTKRDITNKT